MAEGDLPSVPAYDKDDKDEAPATAATATITTESRRPGIFVPVSRLRDHLLISTLLTVLALVLFFLTLIWDQNLWMAPLALITLILSGTYALWCGRTLAQVRLSPPEPAEPV